MCLKKVIYLKTQFQMFDCLNAELRRLIAPVFLIFFFLNLYYFQEFDALYGPAWHCIVGKSFGSFVTHASGGFVYFSIDKLSFLLFKTEVRPVVATKKPPLLLKYKS